MSLKIFKPNPRVTGAIFDFDFGPSRKGETLDGEISLFISSVLQGSWNAAGKTGSFKENAKNPEKTVTAKFTEFEVGAFLNAIKRRVEFKAYHSTDKGHTTFAFTPSKDEASGEFRGFLFSIIKDNKQKFFIPITAGEVEALAAYLDWGLKMLFTNRFRAKKARYNSAPRQERAEAAPAQREPEAAAEEQKEPDPFTEEAQLPQEEQEAAPESQADENPFG